MALHWLLALMIVASFSVGLYMTSLPFSPLQLKLVNWHKWAGITILALSALRLLWRLSHPPPLLPARIVAGHAGLAAGRAPRHAFRCCTCCSSRCRCSAGPTARRSAFRSSGWACVPLPDFVPVDKEFAEAVLKPLHMGSAFTLAAVVLLHTAAALKHHFVDRDGLLDRMWMK